MSHVYHEGLPGYHPESILHDGCPECEERSRRGVDGVLALDRDRQLTLWRSAFGPYVGPPSSCDGRLRRELTAVAVFLEGAGISPEEVLERWRA
jgi:hypothetical protein